MKIEIIVPARRTFFPNQWRKVVHVFGLTGPAIAASIPSDVHVSLTEQSVDPIDLEKDVDMVGISVTTSTALEAYRIADAYLKQRSDVTVVLGGIHATMLPEEAIQHGHCVVMGESDELWPEIVEDYKKGSLKKFYRCTRLPDLSRLSHPKRELLKGKSLYAFSTVQTSRGCPYNCYFCSVHLFFGGKYRTRPIENVIDEIRGMNSKYLFFLDDNPVGNVRYAKRLFRSMIGLGKKWFSQTDISIADDEELLTLAKKAGCTMVGIGFDSIIRKSLESAGKAHASLLKYEENIKRIQKHGIIVAGSFIFGFDEDDSDVFRKTIRFAEKSKIDCASFHILTPYPGTAFYKQMKQEGRLIASMDWDKYDTKHAVFVPMRMGQSPRRLEEGFHWAFREFYSIRSIMTRAKLNRYLSLYLLVSLTIHYAVHKNRQLTEGRGAMGWIKRLMFWFTERAERKVVGFCLSCLTRKRATTGRSIARGATPNFRSISGES